MEFTLELSDCSSNMMVMMDEASTSTSPLSHSGINESFVLYAQYVVFFSRT